MEELSFFDLLKLYGIKPEHVRLVRHGNKEINVLDTFLNKTDKFAEYTAWQTNGKYGDAKYLAVFSPHIGTNSLFLGLWEVNGFTPNSDLKPFHLDLLIKHDLPQEWYGSSVRYNLEISKVMFDLVQRLVVDWGHSTVSWVQKKNKVVTEIKPKNAVSDFISYDKVLLSFGELQLIVSNVSSNQTWANALSSVNGVYLIKHLLDGQLYVGSAYGKDGILGRWSTYARKGYVDNKLVKPLNPDYLEFSILEILPPTMSADEVIARENRWKKCLGSREFGLNDN